MFPTTHTTQVITPFGSGYVPEQHRDQIGWNLAPPELNDLVARMRASLFDEVLKSLRAALSIG
jgi:hypothetical protein